MRMRTARWSAAISPRVFARTCGKDESGAGRDSAGMRNSKMSTQADLDDAKMRWRNKEEDECAGCELRTGFGMSRCMDRKCYGV